MPTRLAGLQKLEERKAQSKKGIEPNRPLTESK
jgi:hypothetical protein